MKEITFDDLRQLLLYRRIVKWNDDRIELDNGVKIRIEMTDYDCCAYAAGVFKNVVLDAAITCVSEIEREKWEDSDTYGCRARVTIMHNMNPICEAYANADAGNGGYYYSVASFIVTIPGVDEEGACEFANSEFEFQEQDGATFDRRIL